MTTELTHELSETRASFPATWDYSVAADQKASVPDYAVMTAGSAFPAGWLRFDPAREGYVFSTLLASAGGDAHAEPDDAVPGWIGLHRLRKIHPIPETLTGDMMAAAPEMLLLLKMMQSLVDAGANIGLDGIHLREIIARAEGRDERSGTILSR
jgi:hypothetical protein